MKNFSKLLPIGGFVIAVALASITSAFKDAPKSWNGQSTLTFEYMPPDPNNPSYAPDDVSELSNWQVTSDATECDNNDHRACKIYVPDAAPYVDASDNLQSAINLTLGGTATDAFVESTALGDSNDGVVSNKQ